MQSTQYCCFRAWEGFGYELDSFADLFLFLIGYFYLGNKSIHLLSYCTVEIKSVSVLVREITSTR